MVNIWPKKSNILSMDLCHLKNTMNEVLLQIKLLNKKADQEVIAFQERRTNKKSIDLSSG